MNRRAVKKDQETKVTHSGLSRKELDLFRREIEKRVKKELSFPEVFERIKHKYGKIISEEGNREKEIRRQFERIYSLLVLKEEIGKKQQAKTRIRNQENDFALMVERALVKKGVSRETAREIANLPYEKQFIRGFASEVIADALMKTYYKKEEVMGKPGDLYHQPMVYSKGERGEYLRVDKSLVYSTDKGEFPFFVEVKSNTYGRIKKKEGRKTFLDRIREKYLGKKLQTVKGVKESKRGIVFITGDVVPTEEKIRMHKQGLFIIDKEDLKRLWGNDKEKILKSLEKNEEVKKQMEEIGIREFPELLKFIERNQNMESFINYNITRVIRGEGILKAPVNMRGMNDMEERRIRKWEEEMNKAKRKKG